MGTAFRLHHDTTHSGLGLMWLTQHTVRATKDIVVSTLCGYANEYHWMYKAASLCLIGSSWCDTHHASIHQLFGTLLHVIHTVSRNILPLESCSLTIHLFKGQKGVSDPLQLLFAVQKLLFQPCLWCQSQLGHALLVKCLLRLYLTGPIWYVLG